MHYCYLLCGAAVHCELHEKQKVDTRTQSLCDRQRGCRAQPSLDQLSPAQLDPAGTNPSSQPLNHRAANKARRQYITGMWQALAIMTLRSPLGL